MANHDHDEAVESKFDMPIFFGVLCTTAVIIGISMLHWGPWGIALMVMLACAEATVMAYNFMHLKNKRAAINVMLVLTLIAFVGLLFWPAWDIAYSPREHSEYTKN